MSEPYIINPDNFTLIDPAEIFGKDAKPLLTACRIAFRNWLPSDKSKNCYLSPYRPTLNDIRRTINISKGNDFITAYRAAMSEWEANYPEEAAKEQLSLKKWENNRDRQFRIIYGIARRHGLYLYWHGTDSSACCGDQWTIYKHHKRIGRICCM